MKTVKTLSANEILNLLNKQWATAQDIRAIGSVGANKALEIKNEIRKKVEVDGYKLPSTRLLPMQYVIDYFKININYLKKVAREESK